MKRPHRIEFPVRGEFITLDTLLKATSVAQSGGAAKAMVADGLVQVDGSVELRKTCKVRPGQQVSLAGVQIYLVRPQEDETA